MIDYPWLQRRPYFHTSLRQYSAYGPWRRDLEKEIGTADFKHRKKMEAAAQDRVGWRKVICGLFSIRSEKAVYKSSKSSDAMTSGIMRKSDANDGISKAG